MRQSGGAGQDKHLVHSSILSRRADIFADPLRVILLTFNKVDFLRLDRVWKAADRRHAGIIVSPQIEDLGELLRRVTWHLDTYAPEDQHDTLLWLGPVPER